MQAMMQGQGIIDVVNSYIGIALRTGLAGLSLYVSFHFLVMLGIWRAIRELPDKTGVDYELGRSILACLVAALVMLATVSSISVIPVVCWSLAAMGAAYPAIVSSRVQFGDDTVSARAKRHRPHSQSATDHSDLVGPQLPEKRGGRHGRSRQ
jgi:O-antigen ligase